MGFEPDYSLYLVTGRDLLPPGRDYYEHLEEALKGGVTIVQVREKRTDSAEFLKVARKTQALCDKYNVPVIINDRCDIALATSAFGIHVGQSDMPVDVVRKLLPKATVIGMSVNSVEDARKASRAKVDYVGIGPLWATSSKDDAKEVVGVRHVGEIIDNIAPGIKIVGIGGIKQSNALRTLHGAVSKSGRSLDGLAVISAIVSNDDPYTAAQLLSRTVRTFTERPYPHLIFAPWQIASDTTMSLRQRAASMIDYVRAFTPLVHQITNYVAMNQSANVTLALGGSPIMATAAQEMEELSNVIGGLLVNFGTIGDFNGMLLAGQAANKNGKPIVFDPVAVGATTHRKTAANELLNTWQASVIKGNAGEIGALAQLDEVQSRGVDSVGPGFTDPAKVVRDLALRERCIVVMTGKDDWISDGTTVVRCSNGNELLGGITASGCIVGTSIACFCAAASMLARSKARIPPVDQGNGRFVVGDILHATVAGVLAITVAAELAAERQDVKGIGTFLPALIDELSHLTGDTILKRSKVEQIA